MKRGSLFIVFISIFLIETIEYHKFSTHILNLFKKQSKLESTFVSVTTNKVRLNNFQPVFEFQASKGVNTYDFSFIIDGGTLLKYYSFLDQFTFVLQYSTRGMYGYKIVMYSNSFVAVNSLNKFVLIVVSSIPIQDYQTNMTKKTQIK
jgi:hypothetical protein